MPGATRSIVINAPPRRCSTVIADYDRYAEFLPEVKEVGSSTAGATRSTCTTSIDVVKRIQYTLHHKEERPTSVRWTFVEGELMKDNHGSWPLEPSARGRRGDVHHRGGSSARWCRGPS